MLKIAFCALLLRCFSADEYSPTALADVWRREGALEQAVVDPEARLSPRTRADALAKMKLIGPFAVILVVFGATPPRYVNSKGEANLSRFAKDLSAELLGRRGKTRSALLLVFALEQRVYRIRMGRAVASRLPPSAANECVQSVQADLRGGKYGAFATLLEQMAAKASREEKAAAESRLNEKSFWEKLFASEKSRVGAVMTFVSLLLITAGLLPLMWYLGFFKACFGAEGASTSEDDVGSAAERRAVESRTVHPVSATTIGHSA